MCAAVITATAAYAFLALMAVTSLPEGCSSWTEYIANLGDYSGTASIPTFYAAYSSLGHTGTMILGIAALGAIFTGLIGNYIALSRLVCSMADDGLFGKAFGRRSKGYVPLNAIIAIFYESRNRFGIGRQSVNI